MPDSLYPNVWLWPIAGRPETLVRTGNFILTKAVSGAMQIFVVKGSRMLRGVWGVRTTVNGTLGSLSIFGCTDCCPQICVPPKLFVWHIHFVSKAIKGVMINNCYCSEQAEIRRAVSVGVLFDRSTLQYCIAVRGIVHSQYKEICFREYKSCEMSDMTVWYEPSRRPSS